MKITVTPWKPGDQGIMCMPLRRNIPEMDQRNPNGDWKLVKCPSCEAECWESKRHRALLRDHGIQSLCTECALRSQN